MHFSVTCPACDTEFPVDSEKVPPEGIHAICSTCQRVFLVERPAGAQEASGPGDDPFEEEADTPGGDEGGWEDGDEAVAVEEEPSAEEAAGEPSWEAGEAADPVVEEEAAEPEAEEAEKERSEVESAQEFDQFFEPVLGEEEEAPEEEAPASEAGLASDAGEATPAEDEGEDDWSSFGDELTLTDEGEDEGAMGGEEEAPGETAEEEAPAVEAPRFGQRDPEEKAARLARVLVQDMIAYNQELYQKALEQGSLKEDFENEVQKSWEEYVDRIGEEMATSTTYFKDALNEILAKGDEIFDGPP